MASRPWSGADRHLPAVVFPADRDRAATRRSAAVITDRNLAEEYAQRHGLRRRRWGESGAQFRERVVLTLYAAGKWAAADQVLLNKEIDDERTGDDVIIKGTLVPGLLTAPGGDRLVRQY